MGSHSLPIDHSTRHLSLVCTLLQSPFTLLCRLSLATSHGYDCLGRSSQNMNSDSEGGGMGSTRDLHWSDCLQVFYARNPLESSAKCSLGLLRKGANKTIFSGHESNGTAQRPRLESLEDALCIKMSNSVSVTWTFGTAVRHGSSQHCATRYPSEGEQN